MPPTPKRDPQNVEIDDDVDRTQTAGGRQQTSREKADSLDRFWTRLTGTEPPTD